MNTMPATDPLHQAFCENVRRRRKELGLTQTEVAERMGLTQSGYAHLENGRASPSLAMLNRVAKALDVEPSSLIAPADVTCES